MSIVRAIRLGNALASGATDTAALEALLADTSRRGELADLMNLRGQARRLADNVVPAATLAASATAMPILMSSRTGADEFATSLLGAPLMVASRVAMKAATDSFNGFRRWLNQFPYIRRTVFATSTDLVQDVAYGAGVYVAVGGATSTTGVIASSTDGITWTARTNPLATKVSFTSVVFAFNLFIAIDMNGQIITSPDGTTWTQRTNPSLAGAGTVALTMSLVVGGGYVAFGSRVTSNYPAILYSADGITWTATSAAFNEATSTMNSIAYTGLQWVVGFSYTTSNVSLRYTPSLTAPAWVTSGAVSSTNSPGPMYFMNGKLYLTSTGGGALSTLNPDMTGQQTLSGTQATSMYGAVFYNGVVLIAWNSVISLTADNVSFSPVYYNQLFSSWATSAKLRVLNGIFFLVAGNSNQIGSNY